MTGIYSHEGETVDILGRVKAAPIDGRGSSASLIPREHGVDDWKEFEGFCDESHFQIQLSQSKVRNRKSANSNRFF